MILGQASLKRRLLVAAALFIVLALVAEAIVIGFVLQRFIQGQIDQRLDTEIVFLSSMLTAREDHVVAVTGNAGGPPFDRPAHGWYWQIVGPKNTLLSRSLEGGDGIYIPEFHRPPNSKHPSSVDGVGPNGEALHLRIRLETVGRTHVIIVATAPRAAARVALREAMTTLAMSLAALGIALVLAFVLQLRFGLRPLERRRQAVADVRAGRSEKVPAAQPLKISPTLSARGEKYEGAANRLHDDRAVALSSQARTPSFRRK